MLTVCFLWTQCLQEFKIGQRVLLTHFSWQTLSLKVYLWAIQREGQGHKNSSRSPNNCLRNVNVFSIDIFLRSIQIFFLRFKCTVAAFYGPCPVPPLTDILSVTSDPNPLVHTSHLFSSAIHIHNPHFPLPPNIPAIRKLQTETPNHRSLPGTLTGDRAKHKPSHQWAKSHSGVSCCFELHGQASFLIGVASTTSFPPHNLP